MIPSNIGAGWTVNNKSLNPVFAPINATWYFQKLRLFWYRSRAASMRWQVYSSLARINCKLASIAGSNLMLQVCKSWLADSNSVKELAPRMAELLKRQLPLSKILEKMRSQLLPKKSTNSSGPSTNSTLVVQVSISVTNRISFFKILSVTHSTTGKGKLLRNSSLT